MPATDGGGPPLGKELYQTLAAKPGMAAKLLDAAAMQELHVADPAREAAQVFQLCELPVFAK
jgi:hypothetical protein